MAAETFKLTYFNLRGRAEPSRIMFFLADQEFEDVRIRYKDWPSIKPNIPLGILPALETSKGTISDSVGIDLFVAGKTGFLPQDEFDRALACSMLVTLSDLTTVIRESIMVSEVYKLVPTPDDIEERKKKGVARINQILTWIQGMSKDGASFIFGDKMSVVGISLFTKMEIFLPIFPGDSLGSEWIKRLLESIKANAKFSEYLEQRKPEQMPPKRV